MKDAEAHWRAETREIRMAYESARIENTRLREALEAINRVVDLAYEEASACEQDGLGVSPYAVRVMARMLERAVANAAIDGDATGRMPRLKPSNRGNHGG